MLRSWLKTPASIAITLAISGTMLGACFSASEGDALRRRVQELEHGQEQQQTSLSAELANAQTKVSQLEEVLDRATKLVTRASADTGAQVEQLQQQVMALEGQLAELRNEVQRQQTQASEQQDAMERQLKQLARHTGLDSSIDESEIPAGADEHWTVAQQAFEAHQWARARALYRAFMERHRDDPRVDDAQFKIGATYLGEERPATALGELRTVITDHPRGDVADDALFAMANAFYALHACTDARSSLEALIRTYPRSELVRTARTRLREIQRAPRTYCTR